jgi:hypothetical protein
VKLKKAGRLMRRNNFFMMFLLTENLKAGSRRGRYKKNNFIFDQQLAL